jgi:endonuclease/exonuclease/phosphatase family metal-dependent hydrolase
VNIKAASFNVLSVAADTTSGDQLPWLRRRDAVLAQITREHPDVLGLQEANQSSSYAARLKGGDTQYRDIRNGLNGLGGHYEVTNDFPNNCVKAAYSTNCTYQYRGASGDNRILYNTDTLSMVSQGSYYYTHQETAGTRNMTWAVFEVKASGSRFLFVDTHLIATAAKTALREQQWRELITKTNELKGSLPVITVGDFNTHKMEDLAATMLPLMKSAGYGDVLSQQYQVNPGVGIRAQHVVNGWLNSYNHFKRDLTVYSYANRRDKTGNNIDWIFASNSLAVPEWETVVNYDPTTLQATGTIPSDHDMVRATITIP